MAGIADRAFFILSFGSGASGAGHYGAFSLAETKGRGVFGATGGKEGRSGFGSADNADFLVLFVGLRHDER